MATHVLFESAAGFALFAVKFTEEIAGRTKAVQDAIPNLSKFGKMVELKSFLPFRDTAHALENANDISEGIMSEHLRSLLELHIPTKKSSIVLGVSEKGLAGSIKSALGIECDASERSLELIRGIRLHAEKLLPGLEAGDVSKSQLGLGHAYSRAKVKFNVNRSDNMIIQAIALLDQLDKDVNTFAMRVREWYGWHFPELIKIIPDTHLYARMVKAVGDKSKLTNESLEALSEALDGNDILAKNVLDAARTSMGTDLSPVDLINVLNFADRVIQLHDYRKSLQAYLREKMDLVAPNLGALIGDNVAARLISHAGSLTNLSKYPASTVQILGAEKALFRALKTKGNTPKYGLIYHSTFIGRAGSKNKGRISRFLANKCSIASRIDSFTDKPTTAFGQALREQVEERLAFYETGSNPTKNSTAMAAVLKKIRDAQEPSEREAPNQTPNRKGIGAGSVGADVSDSKKKKKKKKAAGELATNEEQDGATPHSVSKQKESKLKDKDVPMEEAVQRENDVVTPDKPKKKKKKSISAEGEKSMGEGQTPASEKKLKKRKRQEGETSGGASVGIDDSSAGNLSKKERKRLKKLAEAGEGKDD